LGAIVSGIKRLDPIEQREAFVLSNKNVQALRTLFNISYQLNSVLGPTSWILVMETLEVLDVITHSPYASSQEVLSSATRTQSNDVSVLAMYDAQVGLTLSTLLYCVQVLFTDCWQLSGSLDDCS
jgi:hypothetical protein